MASGAIKPGGIKLPRPGGPQELSPGGVSYAGEGNWRALSGHVNVDPGSAISASGARVAQTRTVKNVRKDSKTTSITYAWTLPTVPGGSTTAVGSITGGSTATGTFTPDVAGTYIFRCTVTFVRTGGNATQVVNYTYVSA